MRVGHSVRGETTKSGGVEPHIVPQDSNPGHRAEDRAKWSGVGKTARKSPPRATQGVSHGSERFFLLRVLRLDLVGMDLKGVWHRLWSVRIVYLARVGPRGPILGPFEQQNGH